jgi:cell cycle arrest protein BUB2
MSYVAFLVSSYVSVCFSTLATDRGFKERVREDMLVRLLDAFVWRNHGKSHRGPLSILKAYCSVDRQESSQQLGFTYVQGMNVLAAPFLYTMPSELEAFFCFAKFIEESCPLYVQPTLEGVHRGLRVRGTTINFRLQFLCFYALNSFSTDASRLWTQSCTTICAQRISLLNYMLFPVSALDLILCQSFTPDV